MGVIRGILLVFVAVFLFFSFLSLNLLWTLSSSLTYENVQKESLVLANDFLEEMNITETVKQVYPFVILYCQNYSEYVFSFQGYTVNIPCTVAMQGEDAIIQEGIKDVINSIYYAKYDCNFIDCFRKYPVPLFLISEKSHNFFTEKVYLLIVSSLVFFALAFLLVKKKTNSFILSGILLIISSLPFIKLNSIMSMFSDQVIFKLLGIFFSQAYFVSIRALFIGIGVLILGILLDIFKIGFLISKLISKIRGEKKEEKKSDKKTK